MCYSVCKSQQLCESIVCKRCIEIWGLNDDNEPPRCAYEDAEFEDVVHVESEEELEEILIESHEHEPEMT